MRKVSCTGSSREESWREGAVIGVLTDAYLDIETTGLSQSCDAITVVGIHLANGSENSLVQLIGRNVTPHNVLEALEGVRKIFTYNGSRFDLPFIHGCLGIDLAEVHHHHDLMYDCWRLDLRGGFKAVERQLGIERKLKDVNGFEAVRLWQRYKNYGDRKALSRLLQYNAEDVINLKALRETLEAKPCRHA